MNPRSSFSSGPPTQKVIIDISGGDQNFNPPLRGISIGTAGTLVCDLIDDEDEGGEIPSGVLAVGVQHAMAIVKIYQTSTAANMVGWR